jgi:hypothetical protein
MFFQPLDDAGDDDAGRPKVSAARTKLLLSTTRRNTCIA